MDRQTLSDERLMTLAASGDHQAFQCLIRRCASLMLTVARRMLPNDGAAEDVFVDVTAKVWVKRSTYESGRPVKPWLLAIVANASREWLRGRGRLPTLSEAAGWDLAGPADSGPETRILGQELAASVDAALERVPPKQREVVVMRVWGGLEFRHIAEALGVVEGTVRSNMHHGLAALRRHLGEFSPSDTDSDSIKSASPQRSKET